MLELKLWDTGPTLEEWLQVLPLSEVEKKGLAELQAKIAPARLRRLCIREPEASWLEADVDPGPHWPWQFAIWRTTGNVYRVGGPETRFPAAVEDDPWIVVTPLS